MPQFTSSITDAIVVGQQRTMPPHVDSAERVVLFVKCTAQASTGTLQPDVQLETAIREQIAKDLSRRHVPAFIFETPEVPYNANGKKLEIQVKAVVCGGSDALQKLTITPDELRQVKWFERFYEVEKVVASLQRKRTKL